MSEGHRNVQHELRSEGPVIEVAKTAGFCFGVKNALEIAEKELETHREHGVASFGPLIHNSDVIGDLTARGLRVIEAPEEVRPGESVVIRAHGVGEAVLQKLADCGARIVDATCPFVRRIHRIVRECSERRQQVIILGDRNHPEVQGIMGWCLKEPIVIGPDEEIAPERLPQDGPAPALVVQTTFNQKKFKKIVEKFSGMQYNIIVYPTICSSTVEHQKETLEIAQRADVMIVLGGKNSSNTKKLAAIAGELCQTTIAAENARDLKSYLMDHPYIHRKIEKGEVRRIGVTAGASTPNHIIQEVVEIMSELAFEEMLNESFKEVHNGDIVKGTVVSVSENDITLNIGYKSDALMIKEEYSADPSVDLKAEVHEDDEVEVQVVKVGDSEILVSRKRLLQNRANSELEAAMEEKTALTGKVVETMENGVVAMYKGNRVFIPASLLDIRRIDPKTLDGQEIEFRIIRMQKRRGRIMGDRRSVMYDERNAKREATLAVLAEGARMKGTVKNLTNYCAFIDLGGIDGMLHVSEMGWGQVHNPSQVLKEGEEVEVLVKAYDPETRRISLSTKLPETNPWNGAEEKYAIGNIVEGKVVRFADFGAFVELEKGIDGLVHISHISNKFVKKPADVLQIGEIVQAKVIDFNAEKKRISLSIRDLEEVEEVIVETDEIEG